MYSLLTPFRNFTVKQAKNVGVTGYVQNASDGTVCVPVTLTSLGRGEQLNNSLFPGRRRSSRHRRCIKGIRQPFEQGTFCRQRHRRWAWQYRCQGWRNRIRGTLIGAQESIVEKFLNVYKEEEDWDMSIGCVVQGSRWKLPRSPREMTVSLHPAISHLAVHHTNSIKIHQVDGILLQLSSPIMLFSNQKIARHSLQPSSINHNTLQTQRTFAQLGSPRNW